MRTIHAALAAAATIGLIDVQSPARFSAQTTAGQRPVFRSGVDLLTVPVSVLDSAGKPVADLAAEDFVVTVDGSVRTVLFARFNGTAPGTRTVSSTAAPAVAGPIRNTESAGGRLVLLVVDRESIRTGSEKLLLDAATTILDGLSPADAAGVFTVPVGGVNPTRDHSRVREQLVRISGAQPASAVARRDRLLTWDEAGAFEREDRLTMAHVVERECYNTPPIPGLPNRCPEELQNQAREMLFAGRAHVRTVLDVLGQALKSIAPVRGAKHVVLLSGGQAFDQELLPFYTRFARDAAAAQIMLHAVHIDQADSDASDRRTSGSALGGREMATGLTTMTGMTGGGYYAGVGRAAGVFERIRTEIGSDYLLGIQTIQTDADGNLRDFRVEVKRPGVTVRARKQILLAPPSSDAASRAHLSGLLNQPTDVADLPIAFSSYTTRGKEPSSLRVLLSAEIGLGQPLGASEWAFAIFDRDTMVAEGRQELGDQGGRRAITTGLQLAPGRYRARIAAAAADGRVGVIDTPFVVGMRAAGKLQLSDVMLGTTIGDRMQPQSRIVRGQTLTALFETVSADVDLLEQTRIALEIHQGQAADPVQRVLMASRSGGSSVVLLSEAQIDTTLLPAGRYTASAIAVVGGQPTGRVSRAFEIIDPH